MAYTRMLVPHTTLLFCIFDIRMDSRIDYAIRRVTMKYLCIALQFYILVFRPIFLDMKKCCHRTDNIYLLDEETQ